MADPTEDEDDGPPEAETSDIGKALTSYERAYDGIASALSDIAGMLGLEPAALLAGARQLTYGTTRATNAIVEGRIARTAFFTTEGFPDILLMREGGKLEPIRQVAYPPPYVPRYLTFELRERMDAEGTAFVELDEASVRAAIASRIAKTSAIYFAYLKSFVDVTLPFFRTSIACSYSSLATSASAHISRSTPNDCHSAST